MENENLSKQQIIDRIGFYRTQKKMSAYELGAKLGHAKTYFYRIESGEIKMTLEAFLDILEVMDISTHDFFCYASPVDKEIIETISGLSNKNKELLLAVAKQMQN
ncbi:MAG: helix-turn-helix transcriptional regulator [Clostridia bacterium]|nr:helix-turn-helix transcriptional regulator [Clostridia bacterium]MBR2220520.1 helix-turn-helix transcriptional regulator [Clostridia bacterium]MBR3790414.1 helix-turn-helix transcriptional regulator [Clostridia bacterium]